MKYAREDLWAFLQWNRDKVSLKAGESSAKWTRWMKILSLVIARVNVQLKLEIMRNLLMIIRSGIRESTQRIKIDYLSMWVKVLIDQNVKFFSVKVRHVRFRLWVWMRIFTLHEWKISFKLKYLSCVTSPSDAKFYSNAVKILSKRR